MVTLSPAANFLEKPKKRYILGLIAIPAIIANLHVAVWWFYFILYMPYVGEYILAKISKIQDKTMCDRIKITANKIFKA